jgi:hypothetical protein
MHSPEITLQRLPPKHGSASAAKQPPCHLTIVAPPKHESARSAATKQPVPTYQLSPFREIPTITPPLKKKPHLCPQIKILIKMDFTITTYNKLLTSLQSQGFSFTTFAQYLLSSSNRTKSNEQRTKNNESGTTNTEQQTPNKLIILRHDVDDKKLNSLKFAQIQAEKGIKGTYYFRAVPASWDEHIIREISEMSHEVGYHYENMDTCKGDTELAWDDFRRNLEKLIKLVPVTTICMHGSPRSKYDNKDLWKKYDYRTLGILGEPYFDVDFNKVFYLTDTGRRWDGWKVSVRDKMPQQVEWIKQGLVFHSTNDIIKALSYRTLSGAKMRSMSEVEMRSMSEVELPDKIMMTFHPQRWTDKPLPWLKELVFQGVKNQVKKVLVQTKR